MKWLKFTCPFGGKKYPWFAALGVMVAVTLALTANTSIVSPHAQEWVALSVFIVFVVCWYIEQRLSPEERAQCDQTPMPLWEPVPAEVLEQLGEQTRHISREIVTVMGVAGVFAYSFRFPKRGDPNMTGMTVCIVIFLAAFGFDLIRRLLWRTADSSAVCTVIPIDHMYEITHRSRRGEWTVSYLVFYQPDGRYVLRAKPGSGDADCIAVVKYRGMVTWVPYPQPVTSHNGFYL